MLIIPPALVECLQCFDGAQNDLDLRAALVRLTGSLEVERDSGTPGRDAQHGRISGGRTFRTECATSASGEFAEQPDPGTVPTPDRPIRSTRRAARGHRGRIRGRGRRPEADGAAFAIAAPHVSPEGGWDSYRAAYSTLRPEHRDRTFVILATSHYGEPERFGLTRKNFSTPLGEAVTDRRLVDRLAAARRQRRRDGGLLPLVRTHGGVSGGVSAACARAGCPDSAGSLRLVCE